MEELDRNKKDEFIYPRSRYYGQFKHENLVFNANLQEFAQKVGYISGLQTAGKISAYQAYQEVKSLWQRLKRSKQELGISEDPPVSN
jgi:spore germination protein YaaH